MAEISEAESRSKKSIGIPFLEMLRMCASHWKWYAISLLIIMGFSIYKLISTEPTYIRTASILIKEESKGGQFGNLAATLGDLGGFTPMSNVDNELEAIKSPAVMLEVIENLDLNTDYTDVSSIRDKTLYGSNLPFTLSFEGCDTLSSFTLDGTLGVDNKLVINEIEQRGRIKDKYKDTFTFDLSKGVDSVETPIGVVTASLNPGYKGKALKKDMKIKIYHTPVDWRVQGYADALNAVLASKKASVINLSYADHSIERAADIINNVIEVYNSKWIEDNNRMTDATADFINQRLEKIKEELLDVDTEISDYKSKNALPDLQAIVTVDLAKQSDTERKILELQSQYTMAKSLQEFISNPENNSKVLPALAITGLNTSGNANAEINEYNTTLMERNRLVTPNATDNPLVKDYDRRLEGMRNAIIQSFNTQAQQLRTALNDLISERDRTTGRIANSPSQANDLLGVERQQKVKESLYLYLLQKKEENDLSKTFTAYNTRIISPPMGPSKPVAPQGLKTLMFAFIFAMLIPTGLIFVRFNLDNLVRSRADMDKRVKAPFLGSVPFCGKKPSRLKRLLRFGKKEDDDAISEIVVKHGNGSAVNEAFRMIRSNLELMNSRLAAGRSDKSVVTMVTSAIPGSGKTFVSLNLAAAYALKKIKVVLVDVDLRKATLSKSFGSPHRGVSSYVSGTSSIDDIIIKNASGVNNLDVIPAGIIPPDPAELIDSEQFAHMIDELKQRYDVVILDCPPTEPVTDSLVISRVVDRTVYVVRVGHLKRDFLGAIQEYYETKRYTNLTTVLNATEEGTGKSSYGYGYGYGYGYSNNSDKE